MGNSTSNPENQITFSNKPKKIEFSGSRRKKNIKK